MDLDWYVREHDDSRAALPVIVFDGDDTLWATEALYDLARRRAAEIVSAHGLDADEFDKLQRDIDVTNFARYGLSRLRFPISSQEAYRALSALADRPTDESAAQAVFDASAQVFDVPAPLEPHAEQTLHHLRHSYRLTLLTKGDADVQRQRVDGSGLVPLLDGVCIVEVKDVPVFTALLNELHADPATAWSVGNSYGSDVHPAVGAGMRAIWIDAQVWAHERSLSEGLLNDPNVFVADDLQEVPAILAEAPPRRPLA